MPARRKEQVKKKSMFRIARAGVEGVEGGGGVVLCSRLTVVGQEQCEANTIRHL